MEGKYTKGPWTIEIKKDTAFISGLLWREFARVYVKIDNKIKIDAEGEANAKLISLAPELLEALEEVMKLIDSGVLVRNINDDHKEDWALKQIPLVTCLKNIDSLIKRAKE